MTFDNQIPGVSNTAHYTSAIRSCGCDHAVELTADDSGLENRTGAGCRKYGGDQTLGTGIGIDARIRPAVCSESDIPRGVINVVTGFGHEAGEALVRHPLTRKVTFTGSDTGRAARLPKRPRPASMPTTLELGGKSPQLLFADADLDNAINGILSGIFLSNGQTCVAGSRLLVEAAIHDEVVSRIVDRAASLKAGDPMQAETEIAPLANPRPPRQGAGDDRRGEGAGCTVRVRGQTPVTGRSS